ncbi:MAG: 30S ribosome-binding factor RbfA [Eubacterium sp.]|nr:30S ribosome-binding factor RbfA [Eubacterium sp.]
MRKNSIKNNRLNGEVQRELSDIIRNDIKDPRIHMMTSITDVEVAPDLKTAKVFISVLGSDEELENTITGLKKAAGYIRKELAHKMNLRYTPEITFVPDKSIEYGIKMSSMIDSLKTGNEDGED